MTPSHADPQSTRAEDLRFRTVFEQSPVSTQIFSPDGTILAVNRAWEQLWGVTKDQIAGYNILRDEQLVARKVMPYILRGFSGETADIPAIRYQPDDTIPGVSAVPYRWVRASIYPVKDEQGTVREVVLMHEDITEQKEAEERLQEKEQQYRSIFEATSDGLLILDPDGQIVEANSAACAMYGCPRDEVIGLPIGSFIHVDHLRPGAHKLTGTREWDDAHDEHVPWVRKDGSLIYMEVRASTFTYRGTPHRLVVVRDITERVQAYDLLERRVEERTQELSTLLDVSHNVASTLELRPLLNLTLDQLKMVADYTGASVLTLQEEDFVMVASRGPHSEEHVLYRRYPTRHGRPIWEQIRRGQPVIIDDVRGEGSLAAAYRQVVGNLEDPAFSYIRSWMGVPLMLKERVVGMLGISHQEPGCYTPRHASLAMAIANQVAIAIENARLYEQAQALATLEERQRLARELHDSVTQALFSMTLHTRAVRMGLEREGVDLSGPLGHSMEQLSALAQMAVAEMRALIFELRPDALSEEGLVEGLRKRAIALNAREGMTVAVQAPPERMHLEEACEEQLYRVAQEALHNVVKHAHASHIVVRVEPAQDGRTLVVEIADDGQGFDTRAEYPGHMGLHSMAERMQRIGGALTITSTPGHGTVVRAEAPMGLEPEPSSLSAHAS